MEKYSKSFTEGKNRITINKNNNMRSSSEYTRESRNYECNNGYFARKDSTYGSFIGGFSWPPRSYTCSFCKREFRSAQALGGHMNVHRRDRARLRVSSPWDATIPSSSPEPNSSNPNPNSDHKTTAAAAAAEEEEEEEEEDDEESLPVITIPSLNHVPVVDPFLLSADANLSLPLVPERFHQQISATTMSTTTTFSSHAPFSPSTHFIPPSKHLISSTDCSKTRPRIAMEELFYGEDRREGGRRIKVGDVRLDLKIGIHVEDLDEDLDLELRLGYT